MPEIDATKAEEITKFLQENGGIALVDCHATWCGPCKAVAPYVHEKSGTTNIPLIKVDVDQAEELSKAYEVSAMPTFLVIQGKWDNVVGRVVGGGKPNVDKIYQTAVDLKK